MSSIVRRAKTKLLRMIARAAAPGTLANQIQLYSRSFFPGAEIEVVRGGGITLQLVGIDAEGLPKGYIVNFAISRNGNTSLRLWPGYCRSDDDQFDIFASLVQTLDCTVVGPNGLDAGALAADTWYAVYAISSSAHAFGTAAGLVSTSFSAPVMPAGYDVKRRVGVARTNAAVQFNRMVQRHGGDQSNVFIPAGVRTRRYYWDFNETLRLTNGTATAFTSVSFAAEVPPSSRKALLEARFAPGTAGATVDMLQLRPAGANSSNGPYNIRRGTNLVATQMEVPIEVPTDANQAIEYKVTQGGANQNTASLRCYGFDDEI